MAYRKVRFEYYHVVSRRTDDGVNQRDRLFDLVEWMNAARALSLAARTYDYRSERVRLDHAYWDEDFEFYFLHFVRLRDTNIPSKARTNSQVEAFELQDDEFLGEEVSALYDSSNNVLMLQRNKYSLGPSGIEEYLNLVWNNDNETIYLRPICPPNSFELARDADEYRKINIRFADLNVATRRTYIDNLRSPLKTLLQGFEEYEGLNAQLVITVGNNRGVSLHNETIMDTLTDIEENPEIFSKAEIAKKDDDSARVELIDLFEHKAHDFATFRMEARATLNHFRIAEEMWSIYSPKEECRNRQRDINQYLRV
ncbi:DUF6731 family protein [Neobacillus sp. YIM B06451]|uniref:DUF6731 family protein n=1 Tax=Neobacillus sp. YIM B06451 TaxID=3070994 RepID=UPI00292E3E5B|nr:DUF6731 family protein [Neobacillus sp. YIM B06451]